MLAAQISGQDPFPWQLMPLIAGRFRLDEARRAAFARPAGFIRRHAPERPAASGGMPVGFHPIAVLQRHVFNPVRRTVRPFSESVSA